MNVLGNIIWMIFGGFFTAIEYIMAGCALCITIIGIPFGLQCFKLAFYVLLPFGHKTVKRESRISTEGCVYTFLNIIWFFVGAIPLVLSHLFWGILLGITIIGIPFAKQHFKLMSLALTPFGRDIVEVN